MAAIVSQLNEQHSDGGSLSLSLSAGARPLSRREQQAVSRFLSHQIPLSARDLVSGASAPLFCSNEPASMRCRRRGHTNLSASSRGPDWSLPAQPCAPRQPHSNLICLMPSHFGLAPAAGPNRAAMVRRASGERREVALGRAEARRLLHPTWRPTKWPRHTPTLLQTDAENCVSWPPPSRLTLPQAPRPASATGATRGESQISSNL